MAYKSIVRMSMFVVVVIVIFCSSFFMNLEAARSLQNGPFTHKNIDSQRLFHELGFDLLRKQMIRSRVIVEVGGRDRLAPGGPDPKHHVGPPNKPY